MNDSCNSSEGVGTVNASEDRRVNDFVQALHHVCHQAALEFAIQVGQLVISTFYAGDWARWRERGKNDPSLRKLAHRQDMPISLVQLYRCVAVSEVSRRLPGLSTWKHIGATHVRAVIGLGELHQLRLLEAANQGHWTVHRLESEVRELRTTASPHRGRPPQSERTRQVSSIKRWLEDCPQSFKSVEAEAIDPSTRKALRARVEVVRTRCEELVTILGSDNCDTVNARA